jgi:division protein CdvB (Snf7/Vps24/ESCRT-III family)
MSQVESVALWAGLIASIAGIVLSAVATWFAFRLNDQATAINNQMIKSLERIESSVERVSSDTRELITAGWNKMLGNMGGPTDPGTANSDSADSIVDGVATEIESELNEDGSEEPEAKIQRLKDALRELQATVSNLRRGNNYASPMIQDALLQTVRDLPIEGRALLSILMRVGTSPAANIKQQ